MGGRDESVFKMVNAIIHYKICYLLLKIGIQFFCKTQQTLFEAHCS